MKYFLMALILGIIFSCAIVTVQTGDGSAIDQDKGVMIKPNKK